MDLHEPWQRRQVSPGFTILRLVKGSLPLFEAMSAGATVMVGDSSRGLLPWWGSGIEIYHRLGVRRCGVALMESCLSAVIGSQRLIPGERLCGLNAGQRLFAHIGAQHLGMTDEALSIAGLVNGGFEMQTRHKRAR